MCIRDSFRGSVAVMISSGSRDGTKAIRKVSIFLLLVSEDAVVLVLLSVEFALLSVELALLVVEFVPVSYTHLMWE